MTHFLKILEIFKIPKFFGELCQNPQFLIKIIFGVTLILYWYRIVLILNKNYGFVTLFHKKSFLKCPQNLKMSIFGPKNYGKMQSKIGTPKIDAFFKFWALLKCVNLWRRTVNKFQKIKLISGGKSSEVNLKLNKEPMLPSRSLIGKQPQPAFWRNFFLESWKLPEY